MRLEIEGKELADELKFLRPAVGQIGEQRGIKITVEGEEVTLATSSYDASRTAKLTGGREDGTVVLPHALLQGIAKRNGRNPIGLTEEDTKVKVTGGAVYEIVKMSRDNFPNVPSPEGHGLHVPADTWEHITKLVAPFASKDDMRPALQQVAVRDGKAYATDSYRLATLPVDMPDIEIPTEVIHGTNPAVVTEHGRVWVQDLPTGRTVAAPMIDGQLPNYQHLIPEEWAHKVEVSTPTLLEAVQDVRAINKKKEEEPLRLSFLPGKILVRMNGEFSTAEAEVPADSQFELTIGVNAQYFTEALKTLPDEFEARFISPLRPMMLAGFTVEHMVMPIRLNS